MKTKFIKEINLNKKEFDYNCDLYYRNVGNCCGAQVIWGFNRYGESHEKVFEYVLSRMQTELGTTGPTLDGGGEVYEELFGNFDVYTNGTFKVMPAVVIIFLANNQIEAWENTLLKYGFQLHIENLCNPKSDGNVINMYVGILKGGEDYKKKDGVSVPELKVSGKGLTPISNRGEYDCFFEEAD